MDFGRYLQHRCGRVVATARRNGSARSARSAEDLSVVRRKEEPSVTFGFHTVLVEPLRAPIRFLRFL